VQAWSIKLRIVNSRKMPYNRDIGRIKKYGCKAVKRICVKEKNK